MLSSPRGRLLHHQQPRQSPSHVYNMEHKYIHLCTYGIPTAYDIYIVRTIGRWFIGPLRLVWLYSRLQATSPSLSLSLFSPAMHNLRVCAETRRELRASLITSLLSFFFHASLYPCFSLFEQPTRVIYGFVCALFSPVAKRAFLSLVRIQKGS